MIGQWRDDGLGDPAVCDVLGTSRHLVNAIDFDQRRGDQALPGSYIFGMEGLDTDHQTCRNR